MKLRKTKDLTIYRAQGTYNGFPNIVKLADGSLLTVFRQAKDRQQEYGFVVHTDVTGHAVSMRSTDAGSSWSGPEVLYDHPLGGMNDTNITALSDGSILGVFYRWRSFLAADAGTLYPWDNVMSVHGEKYIWRLDGTYTLRSTDGGLSWDQPVRIAYADVPMEIHSRGKAVELPDGDILLPVNGGVPFYRSQPVFSDVIRSSDHGKTWVPHGRIAVSEQVDFYETTIHRSDDASLTAFLRGIARGNKNDATLYVSRSTDGGVHWLTPEKLPVPTSSTVYDTLRLPDGKVLLTYGYRLEPFGIRARILAPDCSDVFEAEEIVLREDGLGRDIGYSASVMIEPNTVLVVYYYYDADGARYIAGTVCNYE